MTRIFCAILMLSWAMPSFAQSTDTKVDPMMVQDAKDINLSDFLWSARPIVVFADSDLDPRFIEQLDLLQRRQSDLQARDVVIITDTDPSDPSDARRKLRPRGYMMVLIGKDGGVKLRKPFPWDVRELSRAIDKMPTRQREIREAAGTSG